MTKLMMIKSEKHTNYQLEHLEYESTKEITMYIVFSDKIGALQLYFVFFYVLSVDLCESIMNIVQVVPYGSFSQMVYMIQRLQIKLMSS